FRNNFLQDTTLEARKVKIEKGNKRTDWSPSPVDVQSAINTADAKAVAAQNAHNALTASLKNMAYKDVVALADLNSTIISGGKVVTTLLDVAYIRANFMSFGKIQGDEIEVS